MSIVVLKTDLRSQKEVNQVAKIFREDPFIEKWSVDFEDIDNVLRVEAINDLNEQDLIHLLKRSGFYGEILPD